MSGSEEKRHEAALAYGCKALPVRQLDVPRSLARERTTRFDVRRKDYHPGDQVPLEDQRRWHAAACGMQAAS